MHAGGRVGHNDMKFGATERLQMRLHLGATAVDDDAYPVCAARKKDADEAVDETFAANPDERFGLPDAFMLQA